MRTLDSGDFFCYVSGMLVAGREFTDEIIEQIRDAVRSTAQVTRCGLSRLVCGWLDWHAADGRAKEASCRAALLKLERRGVIELPPAREVSFEPRTQAAAQPEPVWPRIKAPLSKLSGITLVVVNGDKALSGHWRAMMKAHHPLGDGPLCGAQLRYLITSDQGVLGGLSFSAAAWRLSVRDERIGWSDGTRAARLSQIVSNSRFLLVPTVQVPQLASHVLGLATKRLAGDWQQRYGERPVLVETFVDSSRYRGTCYRAANWIDLGLTQGRGRQDRARQAEVAPKQVFVYPLQRNWRKILTAPLELSRLMPSVRAQPPADWAEEEFGRCRLTERLTRRLMTIARDFWARPMANIPEACESTTKAQAAYRFLANDDVLFETLLQAHYAATEGRISELDQGSVILVPQDTTSVNYTKLENIDGLGPIGSSAEGAKGLHLHSSLAMTVQGVPLGFVDAQCWARDPQAFGKKAQRHTLAIEQKESYRWIKSYQAVATVQKRHPQLTLVSMGDREADIYELFAEAARAPTGAKLLIRAKHDRQLQDEQERLFDTIQAQPIAGYQLVKLPRQKHRPAREAKLAMRFAALTLCAPQDKRQLPPIATWAVLAREEHAPKGAEPIEWLLLTDMTVENFEQASEKVAWYTQRWGIEVFHRTLKSGCRIEDRRLGHADRLEACLAIDMVVAWRIYHMAKLGREVPELPCEVYFEEAEWKALVAYSTKNPVPPEQPPSLREAIRMVAKIGGFLGRKSDGEPGTQTLWRGLQHLDLMTEVWRVMASGP
ncbi:MAG: IS4 family transposase [Roseiflexaceae bacterium]|nr:IS4 family transposase [Roseiflexaceae bacterium]